MLAIDKIPNPSVAETALPRPRPIARYPHVKVCGWVPTTYLECTNQTVFLEGAKLAEVCVLPHVADNVSSSNAVCLFNLGRVCPDGTDLTQYSNLAVRISDGSADEGFFNFC